MKCKLLCCIACDGALVVSAKAAEAKKEMLVECWNGQRGIAGVVVCDFLYEKRVNHAPFFDGCRALLP